MEVYHVDDLCGTCSVSRVLVEGIAYGDGTRTVEASRLRECEARVAYVCLPVPGHVVAFYLLIVSFFML